MTWSINKIYRYGEVGHPQNPRNAVSKQIMGLGGGPTRNHMKVRKFYT